VILGRRRRGDERPLPDHPYRDTALVYGFMAVVLVIVASLTGGRAVKALVAAVIFFLLATGWSWWRYREKIKRRDAARAAATVGAGGSNGSRNPNSNGRGGAR
jgi:Flp pilus assembly protein TadB